MVIKMHIYNIIKVRYYLKKNKVVITFNSLENSSPPKWVDYEDDG